MYFADAIRRMGEKSFMIGESSDGGLVCADMDKTPHLLISGVTGSGKSVFLHSLLLSLMLRNKSSHLTRGSGDQGVDIIAYKDGQKYAIQCKRYAQKLGNKPIQEVHTGKTIYHCDVAVVMTNNYFTPGAKEAATATGVLLWDREKLAQMVEAVHSGG